MLLTRTLIFVWPLRSVDETFFFDQLKRPDSCLAHLMPLRRDISLMSYLRNARLYELPKARTALYSKSLVPSASLRPPTFWIVVTPVRRVGVVGVYRALKYSLWWHSRFCSSWAWRSTYWPRRQDINIISIAKKRHFQQHITDSGERIQENLADAKVSARQQCM